MIEIENIAKWKIGLDESFAFRCLACGNCCRNREDILLSPVDLYRMARALSSTVDDVLKSYCESYIGKTSRIPVVRLKPKGTNKICPLLRDSRCRVHAAKPVVCALYPIGRAFTPQKGETSYILQPVPCAVRDKKQTVREWLQLFGIPDYEQESRLWFDISSELAAFMRDFEKNLDETQCNTLWSIVYMQIYTSYNTTAQLLDQLQERADALRKIIKMLKSIPA